ncbi:MAG: multi-sensor hybrid histidine kinase [Verrucomicrobiales bacterium]|nr:multi-sensor hybrid histidine kinase [Verrucomicrobiales bacterium]
MPGSETSENVPLLPAPPPSSPDHTAEMPGKEMDNFVPPHGHHRQPVVGLGGSAGALQEELEQTRQGLRDTEEQHRASIEEMKAGSEELQTVNQELKSHVDELSQSNTDLRNLMAATDIATVFLDRDLRIKHYTPSAATLFNFIPGDLGRPLLDLTHRLDYPSIDADAHQVLETLAPAEREVQAGDRWYLARLQPCRTVEDGIGGVVLTFVDITERRAAEERLRLNEQCLRSLVESHAQAVWETDPAGLMVKDCPSWRACTGQSFEEWTGSGWLNAVHPDDREYAGHQWRKAVEAQRNVNTEFRLRHAESGGWRWINTRASPILSPEGTVLKWSGMSIDIHARKETEEAMAADLLAMQVLRELGMRLIPETEIPSFYAEVNAAAIQFTGADAGTVQISDPHTGELVMLASHGFPPGHQERFSRMNATGITLCGMALASEQRTVIDFDDSNLEDPEGNLRWHVEAGYLSAQSTPLLTRSGRPIGMISTHWRTRRRLTDRESRHLDLLARQAADVIEQRQAFTEIQAAHQEVESAGRAKDHFLAVLSHELRTPLTPVLLALDHILHGDSSLTPFMRGSLEMALRNVGLQVQLIDDLLDMTRITQGKLEIARCRTDVHKVLEKTLEICQPDLLAKRHHPEVDTAAPAHWLEGDATRLLQLFWNLIKNACKFTPPGGTVSLASRNPRPGVIEITVTDTGMGIKPEALERIFEPFTQADSQVGRRFGGLGLGLAICKAITEAHKGTLRADNSGTGKGAVFTVTLPVLPVDEP